MDTRKCIRELLRAGADVNATAGIPTTLMYAARAGHEECIKELVRGGADVNLIVTAYKRKDTSREQVMSNISRYLLADEIIEERKKRAEAILLENFTAPMQNCADKGS